jgi:hypothetical protein
MSIPPKGPADFLELGTWNAQCFECGKKAKANTLVKHWQGYYVCREHWEARHPQDFVKGIFDNMTVPWSQPEPSNVFSGDFCTPNGMTAISDYAIADCAISDYISPMFDPSVFTNNVLVNTGN